MFWQLFIWFDSSLLYRFIFKYGRRNRNKLKTAYRLIPLVSECNADIKRHASFLIFYFTMSVIFMKLLFEKLKRVKALSKNKKYQTVRAHDKKPGVKFRTRNIRTIQICNWENVQIQQTFLVTLIAKKHHLVKHSKRLLINENVCIRQHSG